MTPTAYVVGLDRTDGHISAARVRCPWCARVHVHRWPVRGPVSPTCGTHGSYRITFHTPERTTPMTDDPTAPDP